MQHVPRDMENELNEDEENPDERITRKFPLDKANTDRILIRQLRTYAG
jgi:hypothetical protein